MNKLLKSLAVLLALGLGFFSQDIYRSIQSMVADSDHFANHQASHLDIHNICPLSSAPCVVNDVSIILGKDVVSPMQPTTLEVNWPHNTEPQLLVELEGKEMSMGVAKFVLTNQGDGIFSGTLLLPVCHSDAMTWIGSIQSETEQLPISVRMQR
ncbi:hypothetical protein [Vibrio ezurae]|uniref:Uncharacterized protein n=1 Tax=Vibrio ezurae NBRC 102218 TaxID=1219080 RepID=U3CNI3_9VIBR|nr:hypothetical protein [Vibrio ezurae]GAD79678.1 hypothetical protein VEZ01S_19_00930 [Vibrio ezurae NBRC 102218]